MIDPFVLVGVLVLAVSLLLLATFGVASEGEEPE